MPSYIRTKVAGGRYFFTVVSCHRQPILCQDFVRNSLRQAILNVRKDMPFDIEAWVLMPDHLHCIWTLPENDSDYSSRWAGIKRQVSQRSADISNQRFMTNSRRKRRESTIWQRRFWEHCIRNEQDFKRYLDYIHYNPVKHGLCAKASDWQWSSIHRYIELGWYQKDWAGSCDLDISVE